MKMFKNTHDRSQRIRRTIPHRKPCRRVVRGYARELRKVRHFREDGNLAGILRGADMFVGLSAPGIVTEGMIRSMNPEPIVFPMANPVPEIDPVLAEGAGAAIVGTGRSDFKNQINNVLAFPGIFRGALDVRASDINEEMKIAAAQALAGLITDGELNEDYIIPAPFDPRVREAVSKAVAEAAVKTGVARIAYAGK